ncbi:MAG: hypothetical protein GX456_15470 [Verrucomicrobia bacterium]|nr:hypothetical protein [Verrucomicrobiota bacterium]
MLLSRPPKGGTLTAADAVGVGRREAFGVRQLAAALFLFPNNVSVPRSASEGFHHRLRQPPIETRNNLRAAPQSGNKPKLRACHPIPTHSQRPYRWYRLTSCRRIRYR